uniref:zinc finger CCCH domain-containing protein 14-like n=1 Tax=Erigeron canadensis TaxID=72917 RepID=UPI001CB90037|nr:zinc finger CCCH domain-containing protein 14-like [Erigeron canadensis]
MDTRKRGWPHHSKPNGATAAAAASYKKSKSESESLSSGIRGKTKPCMKYFSIDGCPFGENCHFLHFFPGGYNAVAQLMNLPPISTAQATTQNGPQAVLRSKLCNKYNTPEGCKFGDQCSFAHGEWELGKPIAPSHEPPRALPSVIVRPAPPSTATSFGASATAKISVDASLVGAIIGKGGANSKQISRQTGVKLSIRDHESDTSIKNIELEGTFDQIKEANALVEELISSLTIPPGAAGPPGRAPPLAMHRGAPPHTMTSNKKTKLCENFIKGSCTFGERCHFAHGATELRK